MSNLNQNIVNEMNGNYWDELMAAFSDYCEMQPNLWFDDVTDEMFADFVKMYCGA